MKRWLIVGALGILLSASVAPPILFAETVAPVIEWTHKIGGLFTEEAYGVETDSGGNVYVAGQMDADRFLPISGEGDVFLNKFDASGSLLWQRRIGSAGLDLAWDIAIDSQDNIALAGFTSRNLSGINTGDFDVLLTKIDSHGSQLWTRQLGSTNSDQAFGVDTDALGNIYLAGVAGGQLDARRAESDDLFVAKFDAAGSHLWTRQAGSPAEDTVLALAADSLGNSYVTGWTRGSLGGAPDGFTDAFVRKYGPLGDILWTRQFGTDGEDIGLEVATDAAGNVFVTGYTSGNLFESNAGAVDGYVLKLDPAGNIVWQDQFGGSSNNVGQGIAVDETGRVYVAGSTVVGPLEPAPFSNLADEDVIVRKYDVDGELIWNTRFGSNDFEQGMAVAVGGTAHLYVVGRMRDPASGPQGTRMDAFVTKLREIPEPPATLLTICSLICSGFLGPRLRVNRAASNDSRCVKALTQSDERRT